MELIKNIYIFDTMETNEKINFEQFLERETKLLADVNQAVKLKHEIDDEDIPVLLPYLKKYRERES